jgi:branched-chain amino acid transport system ATP-binding protein
VGEQRLSASDGADLVTSGAARLEVTGVSYSYGALQALTDVNVEVSSGSVCSILGPNGAGKSTLASVIVGAVIPSSGSVRLNGVDITAERMFSRIRRGIAYVPEGGAVFPALTVAENLVVGDRGRVRRGAREIFERAADLFPFLARRWSDRAGTLSGGEQQMLSLARVLAHNQRLVVIDELSHGLAPAIIDQLFAVLTRHKGRMTFIIIEQYVARAQAIADELVILSHGRVTFAGPGRDLKKGVIDEAYDL